MIEKWIFEEPYLNKTIGELIDKNNLKVDCLLGSYINYTPKQLLQHYNTEINLANELLTSSIRNYSEVYDQLFREVPFHPQIQDKTDPNRFKIIERQFNNLKKHFTPDTTYMEIGPGDCMLSIHISKHVKQVYAIDVSDEITKNLNTPDNFKLTLSDGSSIPLPPNSVDVAFSNQLMEHLHPDDVTRQLTQIVNALKPGGIYICSTPHRFNGPADVSRFFDEEAKGFHLKEYTNREIYTLFKRAGFSKVYKRAPFKLAIATESIIDLFSYSLRKKMYKKFRRLLHLRVVGKK